MLRLLRLEFARVAAKAYRKYLRWYNAPMAEKPIHAPFPMDRDDFVKKTGLDRFGAWRVGLDGDWHMGPHTCLDMLDYDDSYNLAASLSVRVQDGKAYIRLNYTKTTQDRYGGGENVTIEAVMSDRLSPPDFTDYGGNVVPLRPAFKREGHSKGHSGETDIWRNRVYITAVYDQTGLIRTHRRFRPVDSNTIDGILRAFKDANDELSLYSSGPVRHFTRK